MLATETLYTPYNGAVLLENPLLNKGLAFTHGEGPHLIFRGCCRIMLKLLKNKPRARGGSFASLNGIYRGIFIFEIYRILTRPYSIICCAAI